MREHVKIAPPLEQLHTQHERCRVTAELGLQLRVLQSNPVSRSLVPSSCLSRPTDREAASACSVTLLSLPAKVLELHLPRVLTPPPWAWARCGVFGISSSWKSTGRSSIFRSQTAQNLQWQTSTPTQQWLSHVVHDVFDCTETCIKHAEKKLEAMQSLLFHKVPSCGLWSFRA